MIQEFILAFSLVQNMCVHTCINMLYIHIHALHILYIHIHALHTHTHTPTYPEHMCGFIFLPRTVCRAAEQHTRLYFSKLLFD